MNIKELSKWTDEQVFIKTEKHLDSLQKSILEGVLQHPDFGKIANNNGYSYDHIRKEGAKLWKLLSKVFQEDIKQSNVRSILENKAPSTIYNFANSAPIVSSNINNHINICPEKTPSLESKENPDSAPKTKKEYPIIDLKEAPEIEYDIDRPSDISTIKNWLENNSKLITIYGLSEMGKTALSLKLISEIQEEFDYIIYRSFHYKKRTFETIKTEIKQILDQEKTGNKLIDYLQSSRCLLIIDNLENIFKTGELSGEYLTEYKDYSNFFKQIAKNNHQSCLILISWEQPKEGTTTGGLSLHLQGLGEEAKQLFRKKGLKDEEKWTELITLYQGHPTWLNNIADTINDYYNGKVSLFLSEHSEVFLDDLETIITPHFDRLSELEKKALNWLENQNESVNIIPREFLAAIKSLIRRGLIEKNNSHFIINPVFKAYCRVGNCSD